MLTDTRLKNLKPQHRLYKIADRDGLYVAVLPSGGVSFRFNYRVNGRQETVTLGRYGVGGMTLAEARTALAEARKTLNCLFAGRIDPLGLTHSPGSRERRDSVVRPLKSQFLQVLMDLFQHAPAACVIAPPRS